MLTLKVGFLSNGNHIYQVNILLNLIKNINYNIIFIINVTTGAKKHHIELAVFGYNKDNTPGAKRTYINQNNLY